MRECRACGRTLPTSAFLADKKSADGYLRRCRECVNDARRIARRRAIDEGRPWRTLSREYQRAHRLRNPAAYRAAQLKHKYGITPAGRDAMLAAQGGRCGICRDPLDAPHVDHSHETGKVRGLLCGHCNKALGLLKDSAANAARAAAYLGRHELMGVE